jgi:hypothetical protein
VKKQWPIRAPLFHLRVLPVHVVNGNWKGMWLLKSPLIISLQQEIRKPTHLSVLNVFYKPYFACSFAQLNVERNKRISQHLSHGSAIRIQRQMCLKLSASIRHRVNAHSVWVLPFLVYSLCANHGHTDTSFPTVGLTCALHTRTVNVSPADTAWKSPE